MNLLKLFGFSSFKKTKTRKTRRNKIHRNKTRRNKNGKKSFKRVYHMKGG